ncbi:energy transducer TonB, partial [Empedobacter sp. UBA5036]|uniref:energy transducer TonB n=2 Tax=unclassified Empedobacter TaxID=2643773 RepID=UPI0025BEDF50
MQKDESIKKKDSLTLNYIDMSNKAFLDILFENRNKEYGAYQLRQVASQDLMKSLFVGIGIVALITGGTIYANNKTMNNEITKKDDGVIVILDNVTPPDKKIEEVTPPKEDPPMEEKTIQLKTDQAKHIIPTPTESPKVEETIKSVDELKKVDLGLFEREGDPSKGQVGGGEVSDTGSNVGGANKKIPEGSTPIKDPVKPDVAITAKNAAVMAIYPGCESESKKGNAALTKCMSDKISKELGGELSDFAETASRNNIGSAVAKMQFIVNKNGEISQVKPLSGSNQDLGKEAKSALERINKQILRKGKKITPTLSHEV